MIYRPPENSKRIFPESTYLAVPTELRINRLEIEVEEEIISIMN
jgi:hypothetical protein